jgi:hypothetical protein
MQMPLFPCSLFQYLLTYPRILSTREFQGALSPFVFEIFKASVTVCVCLGELISEIEIRERIKRH